MKTKVLLYIVLSTFFPFFSIAQEIIRNEIGNTSINERSRIKIELWGRIQHFDKTPKNKKDFFDTHIASPKSVSISDTLGRFFIQNLEGYNTSVYDMKTLELKKSIYHLFSERHKYLFNNETTVFDYSYKKKKDSFNVFDGKPVEAAFAHNEKYLFVSYYRRSFDTNAESPSALAVIETEKNEIVRILPTGPLPKMVAVSPNNAYLAVTHWGDNTIGIVDISTPEVDSFRYIKHLVVEKKIVLDFKDEKINRDNDCGYCLRGTVFTPDSKYLFVGRMGGKGGIAVFDTKTWNYRGTIFGIKNNVRHLLIADRHLMLSTNNSGYVQAVLLSELYKLIESKNKKMFLKPDPIRSAYVGKGVRTISYDTKRKILYACVNKESKIVAIDFISMKMIDEISADSYPVGMDISKDGNFLIVTSQGYNLKGGNSVEIFRIQDK